MPIRFVNIYKQFVCWLNGIEEDNPLPLETKNIYFILEYSNNDIKISYTANEWKMEIMDYGTYFPIEAWYFSCGELKKIAKEMFDENRYDKNTISNYIYSIFKMAFRAIKRFDNCTLYYGERFLTMYKNA